MPWNRMSIMEQRREFVSLARLEGANVSALCRRAGISRDTAYRWLGREDHADLSRRPHNSPSRTSDALEAAVLTVRDAHPAWGARKIHRVLLNQALSPPSPSTIQAILTRHGRISGDNPAAPARERFEKEAPNQLWQMDFKGQFQMANAQWCWPLTIVDDHSRFSLCLKACAGQNTATVKAMLEATFRQYGLPVAFYVDNGAPWGGGVPGQYTPLRVWLLKLGVDIIHARPYTPQSRGKNERFHRTLKAEVLTGNVMRDMDHTQKAFDLWRHVYNHDRPHQSLEMRPPISRYQPSSRSMPDRVQDIVYDIGEIVRKVPEHQPVISFKARSWRVPKAFKGEKLAIRPSNEDGIYNICFGAKHVATIDLKRAQSAE